MTQVFKTQMSEIFKMAWTFVRCNRYTLSEALKVAWMNVKLKKAMKCRIVRFWFQKVDGSLREAWGSLAENVIPMTGDSGRKPNDTVQVYYDTEKAEWRCYKKANLLRIA